MNTITPPHSIDAEQAVIGSMMLKNDCINQVVGVLSASDFYSRPHRIIFSAITELNAQLKPADGVTVHDYLNDENDSIGQVGGYSYIMELAKQTPSAANVMAYVEIVRATAERRNILSKSNALIDAVLCGDADEIEQAKLGVAGAKSSKKKKLLFSMQDQIEAMQRVVFSEPAPIDGVFKECMPIGEPAILTAPGGVGKSFTTLAMGIALATGEKVFAGHGGGALTPTKKGKCVIIAGEDSLEDYQRRLHGLMKARNLSEDQRREIMANLMIISLRGEDIRIVSDEKGGTRATDFVDNLCESLLPLGDIRLVIIDPMIRFYGANENDNASATLFINQINRLCDTLSGKPACLLVHHSSKAEKGGARGASAFVDGVRTQLSMLTLEMKKSGDKTAIIEPGDRNKIVLEMKKSNHFKYWDEPVLLQRGEFGELNVLDTDGDRMNQRELERIANQERKSSIVEYASSRFSGATKQEFESNRENIGWTVQPPSRDKFRAILGELIDSGQLIFCKDTKRIFTPKNHARQNQGDVDF